jgi:hypothetical protein
MSIPAGNLRISAIKQWSTLRSAASAHMSQIMTKYPACQTNLITTQPDLLAAMAAHLGITEINPNHPAEDFEAQFRSALVGNKIFRVLEVGPGGSPLSVFIPDYPGLTISAIDLKSVGNNFPEIFICQHPIPEWLARIDYQHGDMFDIGSVFPGVKFDLIYFRGVMSVSQCPVEMEFMERIEYFNHGLMVIIQALSQNPKAAVFAAAFRSYLAVQPSIIPGIKTIYWEPVADWKEIIILNWQDHWGADSFPAWLGVFTREDPVAEK